MRLRILAILVAAVGVGLSQIASAADWPTKPVRIISPTSPGGVSDTFARMLAEGFADMFGQRFYVENRVGAGGLIGVAAAANAEPDGSTLVISGIAYTVIAPAASPNPGFHPMRDLTHIAYLGGPPIVFVVNPSIGVRSLADLAEYARRTGTLNYGSPGVGTLGHFIAERFAREASVSDAAHSKPRRVDRDDGSRCWHRRIGVNRLELGPWPNPGRPGDSDRRLIGDTIGRSAAGPDAQGARLSKPRHLDLVRSFWTCQDAARRRREGQSGGVRGAPPTGGARARSTRRDRDQDNEPGGIHRLYGE
jgi:hypothetical protein